MRRLERAVYGTYARTRYGRSGIPTRINDERFRLHPDCRGVAAWSHGHATRLYEPEVWRLLDPHVRPDDVIADVGANVGVYTVGFARRLESGRVYAFEPDPVNLRHLRFHVRVNGVEERVEIVDAAVGDVDGSLQFAVRGVVTSSVAGLSDFPSETGREESVRQVRLSTFFERLDILKVDVEGYEGHVLQGCAELFVAGARRPRVMLLEIHPALLPRAGHDAEQLRSWLEERGYEVEGVTTERDDGQIHWLASDVARLAQ